MKALQRQVKQNKCIEIPSAGKFKRLPTGTTACFMPALDLLASGRFKFPENDFNISPMSKAAIKFHQSELLSLSAISQAADCTREEAATTLKLIFNCFVEQARLGKLCSVNLTIGVLTYTVATGELQFVNSIAPVQDETSDYI